MSGCPTENTGWHPYDLCVSRLERAHFILYVTDQQRGSRFYTAALDAEPQLDVPGMTEFSLGSSAVLGLMPTEAIRRLLPGLPEHLHDATSISTGSCARCHSGKPSVSRSARRPRRRRRRTASSAITQYGPRQ